MAFVTFEIIGDDPDASQLSLTKFLCNASPASGGFEAGGTLCQDIRIIVGPDVSNDGKTGLQDAIYVLQAVAGLRACYLGDMDLEKAIHALQIVSVNRK